MVIAETSAISVAAEWGNDGDTLPFLQGNNGA